MCAVECPDICERGGERVLNGIAYRVFMVAAGRLLWRQTMQADSRPRRLKRTSVDTRYQNWIRVRKSRRTPVRRHFGTWHAASLPSNYRYNRLWLKSRMPRHLTDWKMSESWCMPEVVFLPLCVHRSHVFLFCHGRSYQGRCRNSPKYVRQKTPSSGSVLPVMPLQQTRKRYEPPFSKAYSSLVLL